MSDPPPGVYKIEKDPDRYYVIHAELSPPRLTRLAPSGATDLGVETRVVFLTQNAAGEPLELDPRWPIKASLRVTQPSGKAMQLPVITADSGRFEAIWKPAEAELHRLELSGLVRLPDGTDFDVFTGSADGGAKQIEVSDLRSYWLRLVTPKPAKGLQVVPWAETARIELALIDPEQQLVEDLADLVREPETWLTLELIDPSGIALTPPVALHPTTSGTFIATVPLDLDWLGISGLTRLGQLYLRVHAQPQRLGEERYLNAIRLPEEIDDHRVGDDPMSTGPIDVLLPWWLVALAPISVLGLFALPPLLLLLLVPALLIKRRDKALGVRVELRVFDMVTDPTGISAKPFPLSGRRYFKLDGQVAPLVEGQRVAAERFRVARLYIPGKARVHLEYRWQNQKKVYANPLVAGSYRSLRGLEQGSTRMVVMLTERISRRRGHPG